MTVNLDQIKGIKPGATESFNCDADKMYSVAAALSTLKRKGMPDGIVGYEHKKFFDRNIVTIRALREGDVPILNK